MYGYSYAASKSDVWHHVDHSAMPTRATTSRVRWGAAEGEGALGQRRSPAWWGRRAVCLLAVTTWCMFGASTGRDLRLGECMSI